MEQIIVVGGGLAGLSAAHTAMERGARVLVIDKNGFFGGNSTKATSGINGAGETILFFIHRLMKMLYMYYYYLHLELKYHTMQHGAPVLKKKLHPSY